MRQRVRHNSRWSEEVMCLATLRQDRWTAIINQRPSPHEFIQYLFSLNPTTSPQRADQAKKYKLVFILLTANSQSLFDKQLYTINTFQMFVIIKKNIYHSRFFIRNFYESSTIAQWHGKIYSYMSLSFDQIPPLALMVSSIYISTR